MIPEKLQSGDEVRVIAPARSASDIDERVLDRAKAALESLGLKVTFSKNAFSQSQRGCPTDDMISDIILSKNIDPKIPVIVNLDFGHTDPKFTYPVGGKCRVVAGDNIKIVIHCDD